MKVTSLTIAGLLLAILFVHLLRWGSFGRLWKAMSGGGSSSA